jgi:hypothetical protein
MTFLPLDEQTLTELRRRSVEASDAETRTRYQMLLLGAGGQTSLQIAAIVLRRHDTGVRVLKRFLTGGLKAGPRRFGTDRERTITPAWEVELPRVQEMWGAPSLRGDGSEQSYTIRIQDPSSLRTSGICPHSMWLSISADSTRRGPERFR